MKNVSVQTKVPWHQKYRKHILACCAAIVVVATGYYAAQTHVPRITPVPTPTSVPSVSVTPQPSSATNCDETLWKHVYNPARLQVIERCKTVSGTIEVIRHEADGDEHILVKLDPQFSDLVNDVNVSKQHGDLVIEPVCFSNPTQQDTLDQGVCDGFTQDFHLTVGEHVSITGAYVLDTQHGWNEIHPITSVN